jgi:hypothetical protein
LDDDDGDDGEAALEYLAYDTYEAEKYVARSPHGDHRIGWLNMSASEGAELNRVYFSLLAFPGTYGQMGAGAAPNDPIFWPIHPIFDKSWQALRLSPKFSDADMVWNNTAASASCNGTGWGGADGLTPFASLFDDDDRRYTNEELWELFTPDGDAIPYMYDQFTEWGDCEWDPLLSR